jgi:outer membrane protein assembly factor BamB
MQLFGYVCSPHCKEKAELQGIEIPVFAGQRDVVQNKEWGKIALAAKLAVLFVLIFVGVWIWYEWFGSRPKPAFAVRFEDEPAMSGESAVCDGGQIVFLHGAKLARYDLKTKKEVWLRQLVDKKKIADQAAAEVKEMQAEAAKGEHLWKIPDVQELTKDMTRSAEHSLKLEVQGQHIWVSDGEKLTQYDWEKGEPKQTVDFGGGFDEAIHRGDEIELRKRLEFGRLAITRFNLATGKISTTELGDMPKGEEPTVAANSGKTNKTTKATSVAAKTPTKPGAPASGTKPLDPQKLAAALGSASVPAKLAAPATISVAVQQQRALQEMESMDDVAANLAGGVPGASHPAREFTSLVPTPDGFIQFTTKLLERKIIERNAMKAPPKKSALDGNVSVTSTFEVANELLNEMTRNAGGGTVREDVSRYLVKVHVGGKDVPDWEGEVVGSASVYPQQTVNAVVAGKTLIVLDKSNKKKWESTLTYPVSGGGSFFEDDEDALRTGLGPVVERGDTLYIFDQGVLSAFETATGNARWRLPSVGVSGLFFDDAGKIYVNTTTASPDKIKYSRQIDVTDRTDDIVIKLEAKTGREIWKHSMGGTIAHLSGKYIYTMSYVGPLEDNEELSPEMVAMGVQTKPYFRIRRINPKNGRVMWDYYQPRGPLDVKIHENTFQVVLKKEVQVLKFLTF